MFRVELAVYDLSNGMASQLSEAILGQRIDGIWHTGVVVYGREYYFGGGIQNMPTGAFTTMNGLRPCQMIHLGETQRTQSELESYLRSINHQYTQQTYDLINNNCNNFSNTVAMFLLNIGIPTHIVDLPRIVFSTPGGMMLRPMIESMQSGISQNGGQSMDPFANSAERVGGPLASLSRINTSDSSGITTTTSATTVAPLPSSLSSGGIPEKVVTTTTVRTFTPTHEEKPFVSAEIDAQALRTLCNKIFNHNENATEKLFDDEEYEELNTCITSLSSDSLTVFPHKAFAMLGRLVKSVKALQMSSLFILRLLALHIHQRDEVSCGPGSSSYEACQETAHALLGLVKDASEDNTHHVSLSPATLVIALCTLANLVSSSAGCDLLFSTNSGGDDVTAAESRLNTCFDICSWGFSHAKPEVRQMSATLAYNLALASTHRFSTQSIVITQDISSFDWHSLHVLPAEKTDQEIQRKESTDELHQHVVQILCAVLESVGEESDAVSLGRKLHAAYYVCVAGGRPASELVAALGFDDSIQRIREEKLHLLSQIDKTRLGNFELFLEGA